MLISHSATGAQRVCELAEEIGLVNVIAGEFDIYPKRLKRKNKLRTSKVNKLIGMEFTTGRSF